jgi:hypothetical protein
MNMHETASSGRRGILTRSFKQQKGKCETTIDGFRSLPKQKSVVKE